MDWTHAEIRLTAKNGRRRKNGGTADKRKIKTLDLVVQPIRLMEKTVVKPQLVYKMRICQNQKGYK